MNNQNIDQDSQRSGICNLCGRSDFRTIYDFQRYRLVACKDCYLHFLFPPISTSELKDIYSKEYYLSPDSNLYGYSDYRKDVDLIVYTSIRRFTELERSFPARGLLLDAGCAHGYFLDVARLHEWKTIGVETHADAVTHAVQRLGLDVRMGDLFQQRFPDNHFDVVTCWDLIEHLTDPQMFFREVNRILKPGGVFELTTPDIDSLPSRIMRRRWMGIKSREHLFFFSKKTLGQYFQNNKFSIMSCRYTGKYVSRELFLDRLKYYSGFLGWVASLIRPLLPDRFYVNPYDILHVTARKQTDP